MVTKEDIIEVMKTCEDPELHIDIWTLGLIYGIGITDDGKKVVIKMTFTSPMCPFGPQMVEEVKTKLKEKNIEPDVDVVFSPPWQPSEEVKEMLGIA